MKSLLTSILCCAILPVHLLAGPDHPAYEIYNKSGNKVTFKMMMNHLDNADIILFGELHNDPICHWLQLQVVKTLHDKVSGKLVLGAEMFEADNQLMLDEYLSGTIAEKNFKEETKLWPNYNTDYKPLVEFAKTNQLRFIATNVPRRYASLVYKSGMESLEALSDEAKTYIAPLPIPVDLELPGYKKIAAMAGGHGGPNLPYAQALKDATMAHFILKNTSRKQIFIHFNGTYHSNNFEGIGHYLSEQSSLKVKTIATVSQADISSLEEENTGLADFIICVPEDMTKTH